MQVAGARELLQKVDAATWGLSEVMAGRRGDDSSPSSPSTRRSRRRTARRYVRPDRPLLLHAPGLGRGPTSDRRHLAQQCSAGCPSNCQYVNCATVPGLSDDTPPSTRPTCPTRCSRPTTTPPSSSCRPGRAARSRAAVRLEPGRPPDEGRDLLERGRRCRVRSGGVPRGLATGSRGEDLDRDGTVGPAGLGLLLAAWGSPEADLDNDKDDRRHGPRPHPRVVGDLRGGIAERLDRGWSPRPSHPRRTSTTTTSPGSPSSRPWDRSTSGGAGDSADPYDIASLIDRPQQFGATLEIDSTPTTCSSCSDWGAPRACA